MRPDERLSQILAQQYIVGFPPFGVETNQPAVCFTESPRDHLVHLLSDRNFPAWGLVLRREYVYQRGGGPVWYTRPDQHAQLAREQKPWAVRLDAVNYSDWTHEREWRIPTVGLQFDPEDVYAVLVGDPSWEPTPVDVEYEAYTAAGEPCRPGDPRSVGDRIVGVVWPAAWDSAQHWYWNPAKGRIDEL